jgi:glycogen debranching enzyme
LAIITMQTDAANELAPAFTITATQPTRPPRALKYGDTFVVLDSRGDIGTSSGRGPPGCSTDTRHLSRLELLVNERRRCLLGSNLRDDNSAFFVDLTNPDLMDGQRIVLEKDTVPYPAHDLPVARTRPISGFGVRNYGDQAIDLRLSILFENDFADLFEVRGAHRERRGTATAQLARR